MNAISKFLQPISVIAAIVLGFITPAMAVVSIISFASSATIVASTGLSAERAHFEWIVSRGR